MPRFQALIMRLGVTPYVSPETRGLAGDAPLADAEEVAAGLDSIPVAGLLPIAPCGWKLAE